MTDAEPKPEPGADSRCVWWLATKPNGCPEMGRAATPKDVPERATWWTREGASEWWRVPG